jgi:hypothetical protein
VVFVITEEGKEDAFGMGNKSGRVERIGVVQGCAHVAVRTQLHDYKLNDEGFDGFSAS